MRSEFRCARLISGLFCALLILTTLAAMPTAARAADPLFARMSTDKGDILLVLYPDLAPHHVANFVHLAKTGFYDGTKFHRVIPGFMIQGGDPLSKDEDPRNDGTGGPTLRDVLDDNEWQAVEKVNQLLESKGYAGLEGQANLKAEFSHEVSHTRGTLSMARAGNPDSAGSQFFICVANTPQLNGQYTIFGHVVKGMDVADEIVNGEKNPAAGRDAPLNPVAITGIEILDGSSDLSADELAAWNGLAPELKHAP